jgi:hypothetical protein
MNSENTHSDRNQTPKKLTNNCKIVGTDEVMKYEATHTEPVMPFLASSLSNYDSLKSALRLDYQSFFKGIDQLMQINDNNLKSLNS